jgi:hypothetical protein
MSKSRMMRALDSQQAQRKATTGFVWRLLAKELA